MPVDPTVLLPLGPFFLEIFCGTAGLTEAVRLLGVPTLPPIDIVPCPLVPDPFDVVDLAQWLQLMKILALGLVFFLHCGTPCNTFTAARKDDGGPPPLRSSQWPMGLPDLSESNGALVFLGNMFLGRTVEACQLVFSLGGNFSIENPLLSLMWGTFLIDQLVRDTRALALDLDQCAFGSASLKPTRLLCSTDLCDDVAVHCPGGHVHVKLTGKVRDPSSGKLVFRTKAAQVYPWALCATLACAVRDLFNNPLIHFQPSFELCTPAADRKRQLGSSKPWLGHKQAASAQKAQWAGYQLKRGAAKPLLQIEMEPGQAMEAALMVVHPFTVPVELDAPAAEALLQLERPVQQILEERSRLVKFWHQQAIELLPQSVALIQQLEDPALRRLLLGNCSGAPQLGDVCHIQLYAAMLQACGSVDQTLPSLLLHGFPIVGEIPKTNRWPAYDKPQKAIAVDEALRRAWVIRKKIVQRVCSVPVSENLQKIWDATIEDVQEGSCLGPFGSDQEVTDFLQCDDWIPNSEI